MSVSAMHDQLKGFRDVVSLHLDFLKWEGYDLTLTLENAEGKHVTLLCENVSLLKLELLGGIKQLSISQVVDLRQQHLDTMKLRFDWLDIDERVVSFHCARATILGQGQIDTQEEASVADERTRKQVYSMTANDFRHHATWEFCSDEEDVDGQDEATVRPSDDLEIPGYSPGAYVLAADVTYANGTRAEGYLYSGPPQDIGCVQPTILLPAGQVNLWTGRMQYTIEWAAAVSANMNLLGRDKALFPMSFESRANVNGAPLKVIAEGFLTLTPENRVIRLY